MSSPRNRFAKQNISAWLGHLACTLHLIMLYDMIQDTQVNHDKILRYVFLFTETLKDIPYAVVYAHSAIDDSTIWCIK